MINVRMMYMRPGNLFKDFVIEEKTEEVGANGRPKDTFKNRGRMLRGCIAGASPTQMVQWQQMQHPISHTIVQRGRPLAKEEDRLVYADRVFAVQGVDDPTGLGFCTIYYVEERMDVK